LNELWPKNKKETTRTLDVHISRLRQKLGDVEHAQQIIQTIRGIGYKFIEP
jgi:DNA-binding response OmpR family regulator